MSLHAHPALAHELRTPLHGVLASAALLRETALSDAQREHVETIAEAAGALLRLADAALGVGDGDGSRCDVRAVVDGVRRLLAPTAQARGLALEVVVGAAVPPTLAVPPGRLRQVLVNLVGNAVKFTDAGRVAIHVHGVADGVAFEVHDTGRGLDDGGRAALCAPRAGAEGAGLGLAISAGIVQALGGTIDARAGDGGGSVFRVVLPDAATGAAAPVAPAPAALDPERPFAAAAPVVLVVDDDPVAGRVTARMVEHLGGIVQRAESVAVARALLDASDFDVVLVDWQLRDGTGADVAAVVRADPRHTYTAIVGCTASAEAAMRQRCVEAGMNDCLFKPLGLDTLDRALAHWVPFDRSRLADLLDAARIDALARLDADAPGLLAQIATDYALESARLLAGLEAAVAAGDAAAVARAAHALRGSSTSAGASRAATLAEAIERVAVYAGACAPDDLHSALDAVEALRAAVVAAAAALRQLAAGTPPRPALIPAR